MADRKPDSHEKSTEKIVGLIDRLMSVREISEAAQPFFPLALAFVVGEGEKDIEAAADQAALVAEKMADEHSTSDDGDEPDDDEDEPHQFAFDESAVQRDSSGKFTSSGGGGSDEPSTSDEPEAPDFTAPGEHLDTSLRKSVREKGVGGALKGKLADMAQTVVGVADKFSAPLEAAGYSKRTAKSIATVAAVLSSTPLSFGVLLSAAGVVPGAAAMIPGAAEAAVLMGGALAIKDPMGAAKRAAASIKAAPGAVKKKWAQKKSDKEALKSLKEMHAAGNAVVVEQFGDSRPVKYYDAEPDSAGEGLWRIKRLPFFARVERDGYVVDGEKLRQFADRANARARAGHWRAFHFGHQKTREDGSPDLSGDAPLIGFLENCTVEDTTWGPVFYADVWGVEEPWLEKFEQGRLPFVSVEADDEEIVSAASMQSRPPHFEFPNIFVRRRKIAAARQHAAASPVRQQFARKYRAQFGADAMFENDETDDKEKFADDETADDEEKEQFADDMGGGPPAAGGGAQPDTNSQMLQILQQIAAKLGVGAGAGAPQPAAPQQPTQMGAAPNTLRPLEPASSAQYAHLSPADRELLQFARNHAEEQKRAGAVASVVAEARSHGASDDECKVLEGMYRTSPKAAKQFAAHIRTRGPIHTGPSVVTLVDAPKTAVADVLKQFGKTDSRDQAIAQQARQDWQDTMADAGPDGKMFRAIYGGEGGLEKFLRHRIEEAPHRKKTHQFSRGA